MRTMDGGRADAARAKQAQLFGSQYFLMLSPSVLNSTLVPRCSRICFLVRLIMPWRLPDCAYSTFPVPVTLKRFLAPDLVFSLGIWLSCCRHGTHGPRGPVRRRFLLAVSWPKIGHSPPRQPLISRAAEGRGYGRETRKWQLAEAVRASARGGPGRPSGSRAGSTAVRLPPPWRGRGGQGGDAFGRPGSVA